MSREATVVDLSFSRESTLRVGLGPGAATVNLTPGAATHRLSVTVTVTSAGLADGLPIQLSGEIWAVFPSTRRWLGQLYPKHVITRSFPCPEQLTCGLSDSELLVIEALRDGRDLSLQLDLEAVLLHPVDGLHPITAAQELAYVPAEAWARQLEALGAAVVMEVLVPLPFEGSELRRAVERIREAKGHITDGRYEEAITKARLALDYVRQVMPPERPMPSTKPQERTQAQRWWVLVDDLYSLASGASHDDLVTEDFSWSREDAVMIVATVAGLLRRSPRK